MTRKGLIVAIAVALASVSALIALGISLLRQAPPVPEEAEPSLIPSPLEPTEVPSPPAERRILVTLYFISGSALKAEEREIAFSESLQEQTKQVVRQLLAGSRRGLVSPFPEGVQLRQIFVTPQGLAFVDLSQEVVSKHPGGSRGEQLTIYSLANTLTTNFPAIKKVQILVEGREVETLAGHLDLTIPYGRSPKWLEASGAGSGT